jgi:hypothetical protein
MTQQQSTTNDPDGAPHPFNPNEHLMQIRNRGGAADYLPVQWRLVWFNEQCPEGKITILEKIIDPDREVEKEVMQWNNETRRSERVVKRARGWAYFHVRVEDGKGKVGEAVKSESAVDFDDYIEKADTGATGRALAKIGYGTQFAPELDEQHRIVDAPVTPSRSEGRHGTPAVANTPADARRAVDAARQAPATDQQLTALRKLCQHLGKPEPENIEQLSHREARELILALSHEYNERRSTSKRAS